jgi:hypothetical protein
MTAAGGGRSDDELRARFAELRRLEAETAPAFGALWRRAASAPRRLLPAPVAAVLTVLALAALAVIVRPWDRMRGAAPAARETRTAPLITAWRSPTDFLLHTPGEEVLTTTPSFGSGLPPLVDAGPRSRRTATPRHEAPTRP